MDPCPFVRLTVSNLALKIPLPSKPPRTAVHPSSSSPCFCKIKLKHFPALLAAVPFLSLETTSPPSAGASAAVTLYLSHSDLDKLAGKSVFGGGGGKVGLEIGVYAGKQGSLCGIGAKECLIGRVSLALDFDGVISKSVVFHNGWISFGKQNSAQFHCCVKAEPDPRFVFQFDNEPECSPQVFQVQGNCRQPVFTCKFGFRTPRDRTKRSSSFSLDQHCGGRTWLSSFRTDKDRAGKERKGWSVTVHDLSGSPVAAASMVTPFVASPGTDRVSRSNPGSWLILRPDNHTWKPWGRLEAWRERGGSDGLGYRFELVSETAAAGLALAESTINTHKGGKFVVDLSTRSNAPTPVCSPRSSGDFGNSLWAYCVERGFVMSSTVEGEGRCSKPRVEVGVQHVGCAEDAAAFVALAAAVDLSMDACRLFSHKLRKELCQPQEQLG